MLARAAKTQDRRDRIFLQVILVNVSIKIENSRNTLKDLSEHQNKKATGSGLLRVAFRVKPDSFIEVNCTAKN
jgi:hypothetical protein